MVSIALFFPRYFDSGFMIFSQAWKVLGYGLAMELGYGLAMKSNYLTVSAAWCSG